MKKILITTICLLCYSFCFSAEFGGIIKSNTELLIPTQGDILWGETIDASAYTKIPFSTNDDFNSYFAVEGVYRFRITQNETTNSLNLPLIKLNMTSYFGNGFVSVSAGRFFTSDITSNIFAQESDGVSGIYMTDVVNASMYAGYTGLLNSRFVSMHGNSDYEFESGNFYDLSLPYIVIGGTVSLPYLFLKQSLSLDVWGFIGTQNINRNNIYTSASITGPISNQLFYTLIASGSFINKEEQGFTPGLFASGEIDYYFSKISSVVSAYAKYATKDFETVTITTTLAGLNWNNILAAGFSSTIIPVNPLALKVLGEAVLQVDTMDYLGTQFAAECRWQVLSDVLFQVSGKYFLAKEIDSSTTNVSVKAIISF